MTVRTKHPYALLANLPSEIWIEIFRIATFHHDFDSHTFANGYGDEMFPGQHQILRQALVTRRYIVRVCKRWHYLALPFLYQRVLLGRSRVIRPLLTAMEESLARHGNEDTNTPFPMLVRRLDVRMRDNLAEMDQDPIVDLIAIVQLVTHLHNLERIVIAPSIDIFRDSLQIGVSQILLSCPVSLKSFHVLDTDFQHSQTGRPGIQWRDFFRDFYLSHPRIDAISNRMEFATSGVHLPHVRTIYYWNQAGRWFQDFLRLDFPVLRNAIYDTNTMVCLRGPPAIHEDVQFFLKYGPQLRFLQLHISKKVDTEVLYNMFKAIKESCLNLRILELVTSGDRIWDTTPGGPSPELPPRVASVRFRFGTMPDTTTAMSMLEALPQFLSSSPAMKSFQFTKESDITRLACLKRPSLFADTLPGLMDRGIAVLNHKGDVLTNLEINRLRGMSVLAQIGL